MSISYVGRTWSCRRQVLFLMGLYLVPEKQSIWNQIIVMPLLPFVFQVLLRNNYSTNMTIHIWCIFVLWHCIYCPPHWVFSPTQDIWEGQFSPEFSMLCFWGSPVMSVYWHILVRCVFAPPSNKLSFSFDSYSEEARSLGEGPLNTVLPVLFMPQDNPLVLLLPFSLSERLFSQLH